MDDGVFIYNRFSEYLKNRYGCRVYKLPVNIRGTCPNRDGTRGTGGCFFCGEEGAGFELLPPEMGVRKQLEMNSAYIGEKYKSRKYIAYFQNYTNTYLPLDIFKEYIYEACIENICAVYISTRPDCSGNEYLDFLREVKLEKGIDIVIELGLQTVNYHTLFALNRGHGLAEFIDAVVRIKSHGLECCAHYIIDLPMDHMLDITEGARIISALGVEQVKCHSLYILENTVLGEMYERHEILPLTIGQYYERIIAFLEYLDPAITVQRLIGRAPEERTLFSAWNTSWWKIYDTIIDRMRKNGHYQGRLINK